MSVLLALTLVTTISYSAVFAANESDSKTEASEETSEEKSEEESEKKVTLPSSNAGSVVVMSGSTSEHIYTNRKDRKLQPGAITKYLTAMVVLDNMRDDSEMSNRVTITEDIASYGDTFKQGETVSVEDLLKAMLVENSDEAAEALASYSASERSIFISEMNSKVMELGLLNSQFSNPTGAYDTAQYATPTDCACIVQAAMRYEFVKDISTVSSVKLTATNKKESREVEVKSENPLITSEDKNVAYENVTGGISGTISGGGGFTQLAAVSMEDDMEIIVILLDADSSTMGKEAKAFLEYGGSKATRNQIIKADKRMGTVRIKGGASTHASAYTETTGFAYIPPEGSTDLIKTQTVIYDDITAPLKAGDKVGEYRIYVADELKGTVDLVIKKDIGKGWFPSKIYISNAASVVIAIILAIFLLLGLRIAYVQIMRSRRRKRARQRKIAAMAAEQFELEMDRKRRQWTYGTSVIKPPMSNTIQRKEFEGPLEQINEENPYEDYEKYVEYESIRKSTQTGEAEDVCDRGRTEEAPDDTGSVSS